MKCKMCEKGNLVNPIIKTNNTTLVCENCCAAYEVVVEQKTETDDLGLKLVDIKKFLLIGLQ